jgi:hypothetical protein
VNLHLYSAGIGRTLSRRFMGEKINLYNILQHTISEEVEDEATIVVQ